MQLAFPNNPELSDVYVGEGSYWSNRSPENILRRYRTNFNRRKQFQNEFDKNNNGVVDTPQLDSLINNLSAQITNINNQASSLANLISNTPNGALRNTRINQRNTLLLKSAEITRQRTNAVNQRDQRRLAYTNRMNLLLEAGQVLRNLYVRKTGKQPVLFVV